MADHTAIDLTRLSMKSGTGKNAVSPSSAVVATSLINDSSFEDWMVQWLEASTRTRTLEQIKNSLVGGNYHPNLPIVLYLLLQKEALQHN